MPRDKIQQTKSTPEESAPRSEQEELAFLRQKGNSLMMRGQYSECFRLLEDNIKMLYAKERRLEYFFSCLRMMLRCYPSMDYPQSFEDYLIVLLKKNRIPTVFVRLLKSSDSSISWSAEFFRDLALLAEGKEDYQTALDYCEIMLKIDPANSNGYLLKGWIYEDMGRGADAVAAYEQALEYNETNYQAYHNLAKHCVSTSPAKALEFVDKAIKLSPSNAQFYATRGEVLLKMKDTKGALESFERGGHLDPLDPEYHYRMGEILLADKQTLAAMRHYSQAVGINEKHLPSLKRLAKLSAEDQPDLALPYINTICHLEPQNLEASILRARLLHKAGESRLAIKQYRHILTLDDKNAEAYAGLGELYMLDDNQRALKYFELALEYNAKSPAVHLGKARALEKLGNTEEAIAEYQTAATLDRSCTEAWGAMGFLQMEAKPAIALDCFNKAIALAPENAHYLQAKAELLLAQQRADEAMGILTKAVELDPGNAQLHLYLGQLLERQGKTVSAADNYSQAVSLDRGCAAAYAGLARLMQDTDPDVALLHINSALTLDANNADLYYRKAKILDSLGRQKQSLENLRLSLQDTHYSTDVMQELGQLFSGESPRMALVYIDRALQLAPDNSEYLCTRGDIWLSMGNRAKALSQYETAAKRDEKNHRALFGAGKILIDRDPKRAAEYLDKAIALKPEHPLHHAAKGTLLAKGEDSYKEALACLDKALSLDNQLWEVLLEKARLLDHHQDLDEAQENYRRVLLIHPTCLEATARLGQILAEHGIPAALGYLDQAILLDPKSSQYHIWKAQLLFSLGQEASAEELCREAIAMGAGGAEIYYTLAQALQERLPETALKYIDTAIGLEKEPNPAYLLLRGDIYLLLEEWEHAMAAYTQVLELKPRSHEAMAKSARALVYLNRMDDALAQIDGALALQPAQAEYLFVKVKLLMGLEDFSQAAELAAQAVKMDKKNLLYRETYVELLEKNRSFLKLFVERRKLERHRARVRRLEEGLRSAEDFPKVEEANEAPDPEVSADDKPQTESPLSMQQKGPEPLDLPLQDLPAMD